MPDLEHKQKIATSLFVAHLYCEKQAPAMTQTPEGLESRSHPSQR
jgi:hypothetical protein